MIKRATALLALLMLCGLLPVAAQETQAVDMAEEAEKVVDEMAEEAMPAEAEMAQAEEMMEESAAAGPSLDEVLASHYEALGGTDAWGAVDSVRFEGTMSMGPGMEAPFTMTMKRPDRIRLEFTFQGMTGIQASDGTTAWMVMPFMGKNDPEEMPADMAEQLKEQADIEGPLFDWAAKGHQVELVGAEEMEGTEVYKVKLTRESGDVRYHYLDSEYYVTIKQEGKTKVQGQEMEIETALGDYKELCAATSALVDEATPCDGDILVLPYSIESKPKGAPAGQAITFTAVTINPEDIADDFFTMPAKPAAATETSAEPGA